MKHYFKLSALFFVFTMLITLWMSFELGLLSFGKLEAADPKEMAVENKESKPKVEKVESSDSLEKKETTAPKDGLTEMAKVSDAKTELTPPAPPANPKVKDLSDMPLAEREKYVSEKEEFLKKQSEYYEKVILELKEKIVALGKETKQTLSRNEGESQKKVAEKESQWKAKLEKTDAEWKSKLSAKENENEKLQKELDRWKDARAELFRGMYEKMESKRSAKILETMDVDLANKIISGMKQEKAAEIMSKMMPEKAKLITERTFQNRELSSSEKVNHSQGVVSTKSP
ncbi:MAG: MotE family protein [Deltaproteobacteria bacterium]